MIREAMAVALTNRPARKPNTDLWVSDLGYHPTKALRRIVNNTRDAFTIDTLEIMDQGNALEDATASLVISVLGNCIRQFPLYNAIWSGSADMVFRHGTDEPVIVEHKATGEKYFGYNGEYAKPHHVCQLWMYGQLYQEMFGVEPKLVLFYRAWKHYAELTIRENRDGGIILEGSIDDRKYAVSVIWKPRDVRAVLEQAYISKVPPPGDPDALNYVITNFTPQL